MRIRRQSRESKESKEVDRFRAGEIRWQPATIKLAKFFAYVIAGSIRLVRKGVAVDDRRFGI